MTLGRANWSSARPQYPFDLEIAVPDRARDEALGCGACIEGQPGNLGPARLILWHFEVEAERAPGRRQPHCHLACSENSIALPGTGHTPDEATTPGELTFERAGEAVPARSK